jgi:hypothetical protein
VRAAALGYLALVAVSLLQTAAGLAPFDVGVAARDLPSRLAPPRPRSVRDVP